MHLPRFALATATLLSLAQASALATPFYISNGVDYLGSADGYSGTQTSALNSLGFSGSLSTVFVTGTAAGSAARSTNVTSVMNNLGFGYFGAAMYPSSPADMNINTLNGTGSNGNGFTSGEGGVPYGANGAWGLTYLYDIQGTVGSNGTVSYNGGYVDLYYRDGPIAAKVLSLQVTGTDAQGAIFGTLDFSFVDASDTFVQNFWSSAEPGGSSFYTTWLTDPGALTFTLNPGQFPSSLDQMFLEDGCTVADDFCPNTTSTTYKYGQSSWNGDVSFAMQVPEPASASLAGLVLVGLVAAGRRRAR